MITSHQAGYHIGARPILERIDLALLPGQFWAVLGPNGAGKSTLLRLLAGLSRPSAGTVLLDGQPMWQWGADALARRRAVLFQKTGGESPFTVAETVALGRLPFRVARDVQQDRHAIASAMDWAGVDALAERPFAHLSGGEQQRVQLARALAQLMGDTDLRGRFLLLDEPLNNLDPRYQFQVLDIVQRVVAAGGTVLAILHDLNLALQYASHALLLQQGRSVSAGPIREVLNPDRVAATFQIQCRWSQDRQQLQFSTPQCPPSIPHLHHVAS